MAKVLSKAISDFTGSDLSELAQFGKVYLFETVASTQEIARSLVKKREPAIVIALSQTQGRGRFRRDWYSPPGGIYFSYLVFPDFSVKDKIVQLTLGSALVVAKGLEVLSGKKIELRWPNDLMLSGKKVGGILCETKDLGLIVGVGINLNQPFFPTNLSDATSFFLETNQEYDIGKALKMLFTLLTNHYQNFASSKFIDLLPEIKARQVLLNQRVRVELWLRRIEGTVIDLDDWGRLVLRTDPGQLITITAGKVHRIKSI
ncbi:MAG: biotin--[acetyl-CoA-carboxylase] ligase [candidate division WOR-3 bacterium]